MVIHKEIRREMPKLCEIYCLDLIFGIPIWIKSVLFRLCIWLDDEAFIEKSLIFRGNKSVFMAFSEKPHLEFAIFLYGVEKCVHLAGLP